MRHTLALIGCLAVLVGPSSVTAQDTMASPAKGADDLTALRKQVAAQAAEIERLKQQIAAQTAELERLKHPTAAPSSASPAAPSSPMSSQSTAIYEFILSGSYPAAVGAADNEIARAPNDTEVVALEAYALAAFGSVDRARPMVAKALKATDGKTGRVRALTLVAQGAVAVADEDTRAAAAAFQGAGNADSTLALAYLAYADLLHKVGKDEMAHKLLQAALQEKLTPAEITAVKQKLAAL